MATNRQGKGQANSHCLDIDHFPIENSYPTKVGEQWKVLRCTLLSEVAPPNCSMGTLGPGVQSNQSTSPNRSAWPAGKRIEAPPLGPRPLSSADKPASWVGPMLGGARPLGATRNIAQQSTWPKIGFSQRWYENISQLTSDHGQFFTLLPKMCIFTLGSVKDHCFC